MAEMDKAEAGNDPPPEEEKKDEIEAEPRKVDVTVDVGNYSWRTNSVYPSFQYDPALTEEMAEMTQRMMFQYPGETPVSEEEMAARRLEAAAYELFENAARVRMGVQQPQAYGLCDPQAMQNEYMMQSAYPPIGTPMQPMPNYWTPGLQTPVPPGLPGMELENSTGSASKKEAEEAKPGTCVCLRNIPNNYKREMLVELLRDPPGISENYLSKVNFLYLPIDFKKDANLGYAFLNFELEEYAHKFKEEFTGFARWTATKLSKKVAEVKWGTIKGYDEHVERYRNSPVMHEEVPELHRPLLFKDGEVIPWPPPTKKIKAPWLKSRGKSDKSSSQ